MSWIDSQAKKSIHLKYLILEIPLPFPRYSVSILCFEVLATTTTTIPCLKDIEKLYYFRHVCLFSFFKNIFKYF